METTPGMRFALQPRHALQVLGALALLLLTLHIGLQFMRVHYGPEVGKTLVHLFDMDSEGNIPALFSGALFFLNSLLFYFAWRAQSGQRQREQLWLVMCVVFLFLGIDEIGALHERLIRPLRAALPGTAGGVFRFAWVIPYGVATIAIAALCLPVLRRLSLRLASLLALSSIVYVTGALGLEMIGGRYLEVSGQAALDRSPGYVVLTTSEEALEMAGLVLCAYALLVLLQERGGVTVSLDARAQAERATARSKDVSGSPGPSPPLDRATLAWRRWLSVRSTAQPSEGSSKMT
jgi:hypothetical protein